MCVCVHMCVCRGVGVSQVAPPRVLNDALSSLLVTRNQVSSSLPASSQRLLQPLETRRAGSSLPLHYLCAPVLKAKPVGSRGIPLVQQQNSLGWVLRHWSSSLLGEVIRHMGPCKVLPGVPAMPGSHPLFLAPSQGCVCGELTEG